MKSITVLTLSGCAVCSNFKALLNANNIFFTEMDANIHAVIADKLEALLVVYNYPITILSNQSTDLTYCYLADSNELLGRRDLPTRDTAIGFHSLQELVNYIKQY